MNIARASFWLLKSPSRIISEQYSSDYISLQLKLSEQEHLLIDLRRYVTLADWNVPAGEEFFLFVPLFAERKERGIVDSWNSKWKRYYWSPTSGKWSDADFSSTILSREKNISIENKSNLSSPITFSCLIGYVWPDMHQRKYYNVKRIFSLSLFCTEIKLYWKQLMIRSR